MSQDPFSILVVFAISLYIGRLWYSDYRKAGTGKGDARAFPGIAPASGTAIAVAIAGSLTILGAETAGEYVLGSSQNQTDITCLYLLAMVAAGFLEELIFRGYLVIQNRGRTALMGSIVVFSVLFSLAHIQYWLEFSGFNLVTWKIHLTPATVWTVIILFTNSLWFYTVRFYRLNPNRSLLPCFAAHIAGNLGVFAIKLAQGHVVGWI